PGRKECAERDIIGARLPCLHRQMAAVVAGHADLSGGTKQSPRFAGIAVALAEMDSIGSNPLRQAHVVVDDEGDIPLGTDLLQWLGKPGGLVLVDSLHPELEGGDGSALQGDPQPGGEVAAHVERGDEIKLTGSAPAAI